MLEFLFPVSRAKKQLADRGFAVVQDGWSGYAQFMIYKGKNVVASLGRSDMFDFYPSAFVFYDCHETVKDEFSRIDGPYCKVILEPANNISR